MGICLRAGLSLEVSQARSEDKMAADIQMVTLLFYQKASGKENHTYSASSFYLGFTMPPFVIPFPNF
jgi:hypothetical protein